MNKIRLLINKYAAFVYFFLTFAITWGSIFLLVGSVGFPIPADRIEAAGPMVYVGMLLGPAAAGILMIGMVDGRAGYRDLIARLRRWRINFRWYVVALLAVPVLVITILFVLSRLNPEFMPAIAASEDRITLLLTGIFMGLAVAFFEELGWTGFVVPKLRRKHGLLATGLIVGLLWGAWHYPPFSPSAGQSGALPSALYISVLLFSFLPAYRILLVWIYKETQSLLLVILMHAPLSASQLILIPPALTGENLVIYDLIFGAALWIIVITVLLVKSREFSKRKLPAAQSGLNTQVWQSRD